MLIPSVLRVIAATCPLAAALTVLPTDAPMSIPSLRPSAYSRMMLPCTGKLIAVSGALAEVCSPMSATGSGSGSCVAGDVAAAGSGDSAGSGCDAEGGCGVGEPVPGRGVDAVSVVSSASDGGACVVTGINRN